MGHHCFTENNKTLFMWVSSISDQPHDNQYRNNSSHHTPQQKFLVIYCFKISNLIIVLK